MALACPCNLGSLLGGTGDTGRDPTNDGWFGRRGSTAGPDCPSSEYAIPLFRGSAAWPSPLVPCTAARGSPGGKPDSATGRPRGSVGRGPVDSGLLSFAFLGSAARGCVGPSFSGSLELFTLRLSMGGKAGGGPFRLVRRDIGTGTTASFSRALSTRLFQYGLTTMDRHRAMTNKKCLARVNATFIRLTSLKNPIPRLPAARTQEKITTLASRPWKASTELISTKCSYWSPRAWLNVRLSNPACWEYGVMTATRLLAERPLDTRRNSLYRWTAKWASAELARLVPPRSS